MKVHLMTLAALSVAGVAQAQSAPPATQTPPPTSSLTRDLNSGPPAPATYIAPAPVPAPMPTAAPVAPAPTDAPAAAARPAGTVPAASPPPAAATRAPAAPAAAVPPPAAATPPPPPAVPAVTVLDAAARAALPFTVTLPPGFEIVTGRPGPDFRIYTVRSGGRSFVMIYAGPASQFPIYSGEMVEAGGRNSVITTEGGVRHGMEHLFQRAEAPREIHVWTMSLDGAERTMAERIAQSVDIR